MLFLNQLINGLHIGSIYALIALGYTMVYGIVKLINFAHGDIIMVGAYVSLLLITNSGLPYYLAIPITMVFCAVLGVVIERLAYKPLRSAPRISALITAIGVSMFLQNLAQLIFSATPCSTTCLAWAMAFRMALALEEPWALMTGFAMPSSIVPPASL